MAFIETTFDVGDIVKTTEIHYSMVRRFEIGTIVKIINVTNRGYDIEDLKGNRIIECGFDGFEKLVNESDYMISDDEAKNALTTIKKYCTEQGIHCNNCKCIFYDGYVGQCAFAIISDKYYCPADWKKIGETELD